MGRTAMMLLFALAAPLAGARAQQGMDFPFCGILGLDSLTTVGVLMQARAVPGELLNDPRTTLYPALQDTLERTIRHLRQATPPREDARQSGWFRLEVVAGPPEGTLVPVRAAAVLGVEPERPQEPAARPIMIWYVPGPMRVVPADSTLSALRAVGFELMDRIRDRADRCHDISPMTVDRTR